MINIIHELRKARGTNKKKEILEKHKYNRDWLKLLELTYNPHINYYVGPPSNLSFLSGNSKEDYSDMFQTLFLLSTGKWSGNAARSVVWDLSDRFGELVRLVLGRSVKAGISVKTINKVYSDLIPTFDVMLAKDVPISVFPILSSIKYDGVRVLVRVEKDRVLARTRNGKELPLQALLDTMALQPPGVYDGELVYGDGLQESRTKISGAVNKILQGTSSAIDGCTYCIFDWVPIIDWDTQNSSIVYKEKLEFFNKYIVPRNNLMVVHQTEMNDNNEIQVDFAEKLSRGYEGLILRYPEDTYIWKRSDRLVKKKAIKDCVLTCVDTVEGTGKFEGMIGSLVCEGKVFLRPTRVKVGSGLTDEDRDKGPEEFIGKLIDIEYNDMVRSVDSTEWSLFLPRFKRIKGVI